MKKLLLALSCLTLSASVFAQTIVSTSVQKRNVVFEEYTGKNCGYCPNGHAMLSQYAQQNPGTVVINIHQGSYAAGTYTTQWGDALAGQTNLQGYPAFTISRQLSGCSVNNYYGANNYTTVANNIKNENSPVNVAATAEVDALTRTMTVHVEVYYTADVAQNANMLQVVLLQDGIVGSQANYGNYNPSQILPDGSYRHMHMLRDMITGKQWGDAIASNETGTIAAGTYVEKDYTYQIPATISNEAVKLGDINLAVFVSDSVSGSCSTHAPNIWTGVKVEPTYTNVSGNNADIQSVSFTDQYGCSENVSAKMVVRNIAGEISAMTVKYRNTTTEETDHVYNLTNALGTFSEVEIAMDDMPIQLDVNNNIVVTITSINGEEKNITKTESYKKVSPLHGSGTPTVLVKTDNYGSEFTWKIVDQDNNIIANGGPYADGSSVKDTVALSNLTSDGCYTAIAIDEYGDGLTYNNVSGYLRVMDGNGNIIVNIRGSYSTAKTDFVMEGLGLNDANGIIAQSILYPNPAVDMTTLAVNSLRAAKAQVSVVDMLGREVMNLGSQNLVAGENNITINTSKLANGSYFVRIVTNDGMTTNRLSVTK
ncbi:MAG: Omp28-related outer membrane protein [Bacteroidales bacterium]|nr:Omp28-related outer membrane protein [Bacteroidales bacterium]